MLAVLQAILSLLTRYFHLPAFADKYDNGKIYDVRNDL